MSISGLSKPIRTTTTEQAFQAILSAILDGSLPAGTPLRLQALADSLDMSMMPIREAIRQLEAIGVVESAPHRGARVRPVSTADLADIYLARIVQEGSLVRLAAVRFDRAAAEECRAALHAQQAALDRGDVVAAREAHERFHFRIYETAGNQWLLRSVIPSWRNSERYRAATTADAATVRLRRREHERILEACIAHDADEAQRALHDHLRASVMGLAPEATRDLDDRLRILLPAFGND